MRRFEFHFMKERKFIDLFYENQFQTSLMKIFVDFFMGNLALKSNYIVGECSCNELCAQMNYGKENWEHIHELNRFA